MTSIHPIQQGKRYRRLIYGLIALGIVSLWAGMAIDRSFVGLVVYAVAVVTAFGMLMYVRFRSPISLADEREHELEKRASHVTVQLFGYIGLFAFIALFLLDATGRYVLGTVETTLLYAYAAITLTWGAIYVALRYRP